MCGNCDYKEVHLLHGKVWDMIVGVSGWCIEIVEREEVKELICLGIRGSSV